jgi:hypothetical protein
VGISYSTIRTPTTKSKLLKEARDLGDRLYIKENNNN